VFAILVHVHGLPTPGDISSALSHHPKAYTLSLGHMEDLTLDSFAYLRLPLAVAGVAFLIGAIGAFRAGGQRAFLPAAVMMVLFFHAARLAMVVFDPYLSSRPLAAVLMSAPEGQLITEGHFWDFSSVFFYTNRTGLLYSSRRVNLEYGSYAPGAPQVFIEDAQFAKIWQEPGRSYFIAYKSNLPHYEAVVGSSALHIIATRGGKILATNEPLDRSAQPSAADSPLGGMFAHAQSAAPQMAALR